MDLTAYGGQAAARVTGTVIQHVDATGAALFQWSAFDHFAMTDLLAADRTGPTAGLRVDSYAGENSLQRVRGH